MPLGGIPFCSHVILACAFIIGRKAATVVTSSPTNDTIVKDFLDRFNQNYTDVMHRLAEADFHWHTNLTWENELVYNKVLLDEAKFRKNWAENAISLPSEGIRDDYKRQLMFVKDIGSSSQSDEMKLQKMIETVSNMKTIYSKATTCIQTNSCMHLDTGIRDLIAKSLNHEDLLKAWTAWREVTGRKMKNLYVPFVELYNEAIRIAGHTDTVVYWRSRFETETFEEDLQNVLLQVRPLYEHLHAFIRRRLKETYPLDIFSSSGHIPAHILGDMWARDWTALIDQVKPYKWKRSLDVTEEMKNKMSTVRGMFENADEFYHSLGWNKVVPDVLTNSMIERPKDGREVNCQPKAFNFYNKTDYAVSMCASVNQQDLVSIFGEMGQIQYFSHTEDLPSIYRVGADTGLYEAIGGVMSLSAQTPEHLNKSGLLDDLPMDNETDLNFLMRMALQKVAVIPFDHITDKWQGSVFSGVTKPENYTKYWWALRCKHQGVSPPVARSAEDFDPGASSQVANNMPSISQLVSDIVQFQFHKAACNKSGNTHQLHRCDIYNSVAAGTLLGDMLKMGQSQPWPDAMEKITGQRKMDAGPLLEYFKPLYDFLVKENGDDYGWDPECPEFKTEPDSGYISPLETCNVSRTGTVSSDVDEAEKFLEKYNQEVEILKSLAAEAEFNYATNLTEFNKNMSVQRQLARSDFDLKMQKESWRFNVSGMPENIRRQFMFLRDIGSSAQPDREKVERLTNIELEMKSIYGKGEVCLTKARCMNLEPGLTDLMANSDNYNELLEAWKKWRDATGPKIKDMFTEYVQLYNEAVQISCFKDVGEYWRSWYDSPTFEEDIANLYAQIRPLYEHLHAYVRRKLQQKYKDVKFPSSGHIPAHILGNMWAQEWTSIIRDVVPYKDKPTLDVSDELKRQRYTARRIFEKADQFFGSLGLIRMVPEFWNHSVIEKRNDTDMICHGTAYDFYNGKDFRIKMCTVVTQESLVTVHHEMGHVEYYMQYKDQPQLFRGGANKGFHEAIGDTIALSVQTPEHLNKIRLLRELPSDPETDINFLLKMALEKVAFLPFGYLIDHWRWSVFSWQTKPDNYTSDWWKLRCRLQGVYPPVERSSHDFDPGAKYHIPSGTPYIRYFISFIIQFQFHKAACEAAGSKYPLHRCDIYNSKEAGKRIGDMLKMGQSKPWPDAMEKITGQRKMDAGPLLEYFKPLYDFLVKENGDDYGWDPQCPEFKTEPGSGYISPLEICNVSRTGTVSSDVEEAEKFLEKYNQEAEIIRNKVAIAEFNYESNLTDYNKNVSLQIQLVKADFDLKMQNESWRFNVSGMAENIRRQFKFIRDIGASAQPDREKVQRLKNTKLNMQSIYGKGEVCLAKDRCMNLDPGLTDLMANSDNYNELLEAWKKWRDVTGPKMKDIFTEYVQLYNEAVRISCFKDVGEYWRSWYDSPTFQEDIANLFSQIRPLYEHLHAYVRRKLQQKYKDVKFPSSGHIPAHILGNMWAQHWTNIIRDVVPFKDKPTVDVSDELKGQNYTAKKIFETADRFFASLGLIRMVPEFWNHSVIEKQNDTDMICHGTAYDLFDGKDFRIKMCTIPTQESFVTVHHEMGHVEYYMQYKDQPLIFRDGANNGFHEAIGDTMSLSVQTPEHLHKIKLLKDLPNDTETDINFLLKMALEKVAFLPFGYLIDLWRWSVFSGQTKPENYTSDWWKLRCRLQGVYSPVERTSNDFDPGAKYHIPSDTPYIRYFISFIIQFQFHKAACEAAGNKGPLHRCDIYNSKEAGKRIGDMLKMGQSKPWPDAMEKITGQRKMDAGPLLEYFKPLYDFLVKENGDDYGWDPQCPELKTELESGYRSPLETCNVSRAGTFSSDVEEAEKFLEKYNQEAEELKTLASEAEFNYETNLTEYNQNVSLKRQLAMADFDLKMQNESWRFNVSGMPENIRRQFKFIRDIGSSAQPDRVKVQKLKNAKLEMQSIYGKGEVCVTKDRCMNLDPGLTHLMATSDNYNELLEAWKKWRDATGPKMKNIFTEYVQLYNEAVQISCFKDAGEYWRSWYDSPTFEEDIANLYGQIRPLYEHLHAYVRRKLQQKYKEVKFPSSGHIPAHILGNMWAQMWAHIIRDVVPYKDKPTVDVSDELKRQNYTAKKMFEKADEFFGSLGLIRMVPEFWNHSIIEKQNGTDMICSGTAYDLYNGKDFRIKLCTVLTQESLVTVHHEMGHVEYYMQYKDQPQVFRAGANNGFHEAIGDTMALSVQTPEHLYKIGLLKELPSDPETDINFLFKMALEKVAFLPFGYLIDHWRWLVFSGQTKPENYTSDWWKLRCRLQGVYSPVERTSNDFDPGAKYHIPSDTPYIRYFISFIIQFQFHKAACEAAGNKGPLHRCDIYNSKEAGKRIGDMLKMGQSKPWPDAMEKITGQRKMDAGPLLEYFKPLYDFLVKENGNDYGWDPQCPEFKTEPGSGYRSPLETCNVSRAGNVSSDLVEAETFLEKYNQEAQELKTLASEAEFNYETNLTEYNKNVSLRRELIMAGFDLKMQNESWRFNVSGMPENIKRQFKFIRDIGSSAQPDREKVQRLKNAKLEMQSIYGKGQVCLTKDRCMNLDPGLTHLMATSDNYNELLEAWKKWRDATGPKMKNIFTEYVQLYNEAVQISCFKDAGEYWRSWYDSPTFEEDIANLYAQIRPLYEHLHAYVRRKLQQKYKDVKFPSSGHIPAHILGNMWAQRWTNIIRDIVPYKNKPTLDVSDELKRQNYTAKKMFEKADEFFSSLGLIRMVPEFWNHSIIEKQNGTDMICSGTAYDLYNGKDFRIKLCTVLTQESLVTVHHEMGHVEYYMQYKDQPLVFRAGANNGFHEAIGDTMALSAQTPEHLNKIKLLTELPTDPETDINFLFKMALEKVAFLPFGYLIDLWRWSVFSGQTKPENYTSDWWKLRCRLQGVYSPVERTSNDFDPGAKYHIPSGTPYIRYFISFIIQFQFHKAACEAAGHKGPLHRCDIYNSKEAGKRIGDMFKLGASKPWPEAMEVITGQRKMDASALMEYFHPLLEFLRKENGDDYGWSPHCPVLETPTARNTKSGNSAARPGLTTLSVQLISFGIVVLLAFII